MRRSTLGLAAGSIAAVWIAAVLLACGPGCGGATTERDAARGAEDVDGTEGEAAETFEGRASYYADSLAGNATASGERYDPAKLTAAHPDLAFGTRLRVTRVDTGASVEVRVNDRGPFGGRGRVVDLSRAAAEHLDMIREGVVDVRVDVLR